MGLSNELLQQWPLLAFMALFAGVLLKTLQAVYSDQIADLRKERDRLQEQLERATSLAEQGQRLAMRSSHSPHSPVSARGAANERRR